MKKNPGNGLIGGIMILCLFFFLLLVVHEVRSTPTGATIGYVSNSSKNASTPDSRQDEKGKIHTVTLTSVQQNINWKAYVGNVSSTFVLDDSADYTIYQWTIDSFTGQVYISRNDTVSWSTVNCTTVAQKESEDTFLGLTSSNPNSLNQTFVSTTHKEIIVAERNITAGSCYSICTWVNDSSQTCDSSAGFQELLLNDADSSPDLIYTTTVENNAFGYRNDSTTYDFQAIVADTAAGNPATTYYFYVELS